MRRFRQTPTRTIAEALEPYCAGRLPLVARNWPCSEGQSFNRCHGQHPSCEGFDMSLTLWLNRIDRHWVPWFPQMSMKGVLAEY